LRKFLTTTDESEGNQNISTAITSDETGLPHDGIEPATHSQQDYISPDSTLGVSDVWNDFDFGQMLDQQFLDPSWLEDLEVSG